MNVPRRRLLRAIGALCGAALAGCATPPADVDALAAYPPTAATALPANTARAALAALGPGINFGNMLEAPTEGAWGERVRDDDAALVRGAGFRHVRLPVRWSAHAERDAQARIDPAFFARVDAVVDGLLAQGLGVVLNMHHYRQLDGDRLDAGELPVEPRDLKPRFLAMWRQIAAHYAGRSDRLWFELYNEPHGALDAAAWNDLASRALRVVRERNPTRIVVIGPTRWNSADALKSLAWPADARLVATVHSYAPFRYTHQQAPWLGAEFAKTRGLACCDDAQRADVMRPLDIAQRWARERGLPMYLGEFGAYGGLPEQPNDMASRAAYTRLVREAAQARGFAWAYWELNAGFGAYDPRARRWREPLRGALLDPP